MAEKRVSVWVQPFKDRPHLMLQWFDPDTGRRKSKSAGTADPGAAEDTRADLKGGLNHGRYQEASKLDWSRFRELFEQEYLPGLRPRSREKYATVLDVFEEIVNPEKLRAVTARTVALFVKGMRERPRKGGKVGLAPWTVKNYLIALKTALGYAVEQKLLPGLPSYPTIKVPKKEPQPIPVESFEKLLEKATDPLWRAYLHCGWWGGLRLSEARHLRWKASDEWPWVDFAQNRVVLPAVFAKGSEDQWVPLHPVLREALEALPQAAAEVFPFRSRRTGKPLSRNSISNLVLHMAKQAGVKLSMHKLRKGFGCRAAKMLGKGGAAMLHELMRHASMQTTMDFYVSVDDAKQADDLTGVTVGVTADGKAPGGPGATLVVSPCAEAERTGFEPVNRLSPVTGLANRRYRPLSHLSGVRRPAAPWSWRPHHPFPKHTQRRGLVQVPRRRPAKSVAADPQRV
jgi:integrase